MAPHKLIAEESAHGDHEETKQGASMEDQPMEPGRTILGERVLPSSDFGANTTEELADRSHFRIAVDRKLRDDVEVLDHLEENTNKC